MSVPFEEQLIRRNQNADLIMQPEEDQFRRRAPLIEEESVAGGSDAAPFSMSMEPARARSRALAQKIIKKQDVKAKPDTGWKLFSPSTWGIFRNTDWGRKKAVKRQLKSMTSRMNALGTAVKSLDPRSGFFSNASWDDPGTGPRGMTAADATPDANLTTSKAYGMSAQASDAWGQAVEAQIAGDQAEPGSQEYKDAIGRMGEAIGASGMSRESFRALISMGKRNAGPQQAIANDHEAGEMVDGHAWLGDTNDDDDDMPSIVREVLGPKGDASTPATAPVQRGGQDIDDEDDGSLFDKDEDTGMQNLYGGQNAFGGKGPTQAEMDAFMKQYLKYK